ncbi:hypothetical protein HYX03_01485 [Candidatus Woesearchaeota archaeon]|nr:hypothetical protein [Candidatus Woesearchaeota archaeon]
MNKKGDVPYAAVTIVLALGILFFSLFGLTKSAPAAVRFVSSETLKAEDSVCKLNTQRALERGQDIQDIDKDGRKDNCDNCIVYTDPQTGDNNKDKDDDGMPDGCDQKSDDKTVVACKVPLSKDGRCLVGGGTLIKS